MSAATLWLTDIAAAQQPGFIEGWTARFAASERARLQRLSRPQRRLQFVCGHALLRYLLADCARVPVGQVQVESGTAGVVVACPAGWHASVAHSGRWVAALVAQRPVGVDIEAMRGERDIRGIVAAACGRRTASRAQAYRVWTQYEAELKCAANDATHVASWGELALAANAPTPPLVALFDLARPATARGLDLAWTARPTLRDAAA